jgi:hypothetical protein
MNPGGEAESAGHATSRGPKYAVAQYFSGKYGHLFTIFHLSISSPPPRRSGLVQATWCPKS